MRTGLPRADGEVAERHQCVAAEQGDLAPPHPAAEDTSVTADPVEAAAWYREATEAGSEQAKAFFGALNQESDGTAAATD